MTVADNQGCVKQAVVGSQDLLMGQTATSAESKLLSLAAASPIPKHIIYPIRYLSPFLRPASVSDEQFVEQEVARYSGDRSGVTLLGRARTGIYLVVKHAVERLGRTKVLLSSYTIPDVINMVRLAGGQPHFVDFAPCSTNIDLEGLAEALDDTVACVLVTHYHVNQKGLAEIGGLCQRHGAMLFEDAALSFGVEHEGDEGVPPAHARVYSFSGYKTFNFVWGGAIVCFDKQLADNVERTVAGWPRLQMKQYLPHMKTMFKFDMATRPALFRRVTAPMMQRSVDRGRGLAYAVTPRAENAELNATLTSRPALAAVAEWKRKLKQVDVYQQHRRSIAAVYREELGAMMVSAETPRTVLERSGFSSFFVHVAPSRRRAIYDDLLRAGYFVGMSLYPNVQELDGFREIPGVTERISELSRSALVLPTHPHVSLDYARALSKAVAVVAAAHGS